MTTYLNKAYDIKMPKVKVRRCLVCNDEFKCDRSTYVCPKCKRISSRDEMRENTRAGKMIREREER